MATTLTDLTSETQLTTSESNLILTGSSEKAFIGKAVFTNTSSSNVEVTIWRLSSGSTGTTGSGGNYMVVRTIPSNSEIAIQELAGMMLGNSMKLSAKAGTASVINVNIAGTIEV